MLHSKHKHVLTSSPQTQHVCKFCSLHRIGYQSNFQLQWKICGEAPKDLWKAIVDIDRPSCIKMERQSSSRCKNYETEMATIFGLAVLGTFGMNFQRNVSSSVTCSVLFFLSLLSWLCPFLVHVLSARRG